jgi:hypothetical protein
MGIYQKVIDILGVNQETERWYGKIDGNNEINAIAANMTPFRVTSGIGGYGANVCVIGSDDLPIQGRQKFDLYKILCSKLQKAEVATLRIAWGISTFEEAILSGNYSTIIINPGTRNQEYSNELRMVSSNNDTKVWIDFWSTSNSQWVDIFIGIRGYALN